MSTPIVLPCHRENWEGAKITLQEIQSNVAARGVDYAFKKLAEAYKMLNYNSSEESEEECEDPTDVFGNMDRKAYSPYVELREYLLRTHLEVVFIMDTLPAILRFVLAHESLQPDPPLTVVREQSEETVTLSRHFVASLVACGFLGFFPEGAAKGASDEDFTFMQLWDARCKSNEAKIEMLMNYFERFKDKKTPPPQGNIIMRRIVIPNDMLLSDEDLKTCTRDLCPLVVKEEGSIEDAGKNVLQIDFANEYIGGGVLSFGNVQEEIRFSICPELLSSMLIMAPMKDNEAIIIEGFEQFSKYKGYGGDLQYLANCDDSKSKGDDGEFLTTLCAIDATFYSLTPLPQYSRVNILRDLNKAYVGFHQPYLPDVDQIPETTDENWLSTLDPKKKRAIATGNWGCGVFGGDPQLKSALQWLAASYAKCPALIYYTFEDERMCELSEIVNLVQQLHWTIKDLTEAMLKYCTAVRKKRRIEQTFFEYLLDEYTGEDD